MLLNNLETNFGTYTKDGEKEITTIMLSSEVVIKRDEKLYYVPLIQRLEIPTDEFIISDYDIFLAGYLHHARLIDEKWVLKIESKIVFGAFDSNGKVITEKPFDITKDI